jgi:LuxR family maltose regulon positive regulatory protein
MIAEVTDGLWHSTGCILVTLDDFHLISNKEVHRFINLLLRYLPDHLHLIIATDNNPMLELAQLRARDQILEVGVERLRFSLDETETFLKRMLARDLAPGVVNSVWEATKGSGIGLGLIAQVTSNPRFFIRDSDRESSALFTDYLFQEIIEQQPPEIQDFLLQISILDRFNAALCVSVTDCAPAAIQRILNTLLHHSLFVSLLNNCGECYRFHSLFQKAIYHRLTTQWTAEKVATLHQRAGEWFATNGLVQEAVKHFLAAGDEVGAASVVESTIQNLLNRDEFNLLSQWILLLPDSLVKQRPALLLASVWIQYPRHHIDTHHVDTFADVVEQVESLLHSTPWQEGVDRAILWGQVYALRAYSHLRGGRLLDLISNVLLALGHLPESFVFARHFTFLMLVYMYIFARSPDEAEQHLDVEIQKLGGEASPASQSEHLTPTAQPLRKGADPSYSQDEDWEMVSRSLLRLIFIRNFIYFHTSTIPELERVAADYLHLATEFNSQMNMAYAQFQLAIVNLEHGEIDVAVKQFESVFAQSEYVHTEVLFLVAGKLLPIYGVRGQIIEGERTLNILEKRLTGYSKAYKLQLNMYRAYWACLSGNSQAAIQWLNRSNLVLPLHLWNSTHNLTLARIFFMLGGSSNLEKAMTITNDLMAFYTKLNLVRWQIETLVLHAQICWTQGMQIPALNTLCEALDLGYKRGHRRVFMDSTVHMTGMLYRLLQDQRYASIAGQLLAQNIMHSTKQQLSPPHQPNAAEPKFETLTARETEILNLLAKRLSNKEIARRLYVSPFTVRNHTARIYAKLHVANRQQAVSVARQLGMLTSHAL